MAPSKPPISSAAQPKYGDHFDAWNSSGAGHQVADNRVSSSTGWRQSRTIKLSNQLKGGATGGKRITDLVGAGSEDWYKKAKTLNPKDGRARAKVCVVDMLVSRRPSTTLKKKISQEQMKRSESTKEGKITEEPSISKRGIFDGLTIYINGSTYPLISDHKLKYLLAEQGARISIHLGRRQVTHVILGNPCGRASGKGAGGGLAATKIQKEIKKTGGCGIRYVSVEWVLESLKAGIRLSEARFSNMAVSSKGQRSVYGSIFKQGSSISGPFDETNHGFEAYGIGWRMETIKGIYVGNQGHFGLTEEESRSVAKPFTICSEIRSRIGS